MALLRVVALACLAAAFTEATFCPGAAISGVELTASYNAAASTVVAVTVNGPAGLTSTETVTVEGSGDWVWVGPGDECVPIGCYEVSVTADQPLDVNVTGTMDWPEKVVFSVQLVQENSWSDTICFDGCSVEVGEDSQVIPKCFGGICVPNPDYLDYECECESGIYVYVTVSGPDGWTGGDDDDDFTGGSDYADADGSVYPVDGSASGGSGSGSDDSGSGSDDSDDYEMPPEYLYLWGNTYLINQLQLQPYSYQDYSFCYEVATCPGAAIIRYGGGEIDSELQMAATIYGDWVELFDSRDEDYNYAFEWGICLDEPCEVLKEECDDSHGWCNPIWDTQNKTYDYECECEAGWTSDRCDHPECGSSDHGYLEFTAKIDGVALIALELDGENLFTEWLSDDVHLFFCSNGTFDVEVYIAAVYGPTEGWFSIDYDWNDVADEKFSLTQGSTRTFAYEYNPCTPPRVCHGNGECIVADNGNWATCNCADGYTGWSCEMPICEDGVETAKVFVYGASPTVSLVGDSGNVAVDQQTVYEYEGTYFCTPKECYTLTVTADTIETNSSIFVYVWWNNTDVFGDSIVINADDEGQAYFCLDGSSTSTGDGSETSTGSDTGSASSGDGNDNGDDNESGAPALSPLRVWMVSLVALLAVALRF